MKAKFSSILNTGKKKAGIVAVCTALTLTLGATTVFAANTATGGKLGDLFRLDNGKASYSTDGGQTWNEGTPADSAFHYSLDEGKTWQEGLPPAGSGEKSLVVQGDLPAEGDHSIMTRNKNGVISYSSDGGQTWSTTAPDGFSTTVNPDGSISMGR